MVLTQNTDLLFLDETTTYLDLATSVDILELVDDLCQRLGRTVVMVLHDLNLAVRYSDYLMAMNEGRIMASGITFGDYYCGTTAAGFRPADAGDRRSADWRFTHRPSQKPKNNTLD